MDATDQTSPANASKMFIHRNKNRAGSAPTLRHLGHISVTSRLKLRTD